MCLCNFKFYGILHGFIQVICRFSESVTHLNRKITHLKKQYGLIIKPNQHVNYKDLSLKSANLFIDQS